MSAKIDIRKVRGLSATEIYILAEPDNSITSPKQIEELFAGIADALKKDNAGILHERIFTIEEAVDTVSAARQNAFGKTDGVAPSFLIGQKGQYGLLAGIQVHAAAGPDKPEIIKLDGLPCGRVLKSTGLTYLTLSAITGDKSLNLASQARKMLEKSESALKQFGGDFTCVPRTWMWLGDILSWYGEFNNARTEFFTERGLIGKGSRQSMPASTGIGLGLGTNTQFGMDLTAVIEPKDSIELFGVTGRQQCAFNYGSAFSRSSRVKTPAGKTVFISGTASIDTNGATAHIGNARRQIETTIENVRVALNDMNCGDDDVVQTVAYCKTPQVQEIFEEFKTRINWPWVTVICDICRDDLLFEIESTAIPQPPQR